MNPEKIRKILKDLLPPVFVRWSRGVIWGWHGNYSSWNEACNNSSGYDASEIIEKVRVSALKVKKGSAAFERDSVTFKTVEYSFPVLAGLMWIASLKNGRINILDFGGSLGSSYFQNKVFLDTLDEVNWCIVEQPGFVKAGKENFEDERLHFFSSIDECMAAFRIDAVLLSSVLQYLEKPYDLLEKLRSSDIDYMIIDRTPFVKGRDRITVQKVNPSIYRASYPCWFFSKERFVSGLKDSFNIILEFDALDQANIPSAFKGFILKKKEPARI
jgi:putative methyltransferase (TIGR04325 family)